MRSCFCKVACPGLLSTPYQPQKTSPGRATELQPLSTGITPGQRPTSGLALILFRATAARSQGCTAFASAPAAVQTACTNAAVRSLRRRWHPLGQLALASLANFGCFAQGNGVLTPPAYGTIGNATKGTFIGPTYYNVDFSVAKLWKLRERYTAQFRVEFFNFFNRVDLATAPTSIAPSAGSSGQFGCSCTTPDTGNRNLNPVLGSGGPRHVQFGLKLTF